MAHQRWFAPTVAIAMLVAICAGMVGWSAAAAIPRAQSQAASPVASPVVQSGASPVASPVASGSDAPAFGSGPFRISLVAANRAESFTDLDLEARDGREWFVVIVDVANWSESTALVEPRDFTLTVTGTTEPRTIAPRSTESVAALLDLQPDNVDPGVNVSSGQSERLALVYLLDADGVGPTLVYAKDSLPLDATIALGHDFDDLPASAGIPALTEETVLSVPDGRTLELESGVVQLSGVDAPLPEECYGGQATNRLVRLAGDTVLIEPDPSNSGHVFAWVDRSETNRISLNRELLANGYAATSEDLVGPYAAWLTSESGAARAASLGLWGACTSAHGVARPQGQDLRALTIKSDDVTRPYQVWVAWYPLIVTKPDGGAWAFFSAEPTEGPDVGHKRLYAAFFDPTTGEWSDGLPMEGGEIQMGPSAAVDRAGNVHLSFIDRERDEEGVFSKVVYTQEDGEGGWTTPIPISDSPDAGYQLSPSLAIDGEDVLHVVWQDQRTFSAEAQTASPANADIFASDLHPGESWTKPVLVNTHFVDAVGSRPHVIVDGDRLVAVWSVYAASLGLDAAARIDWATRPLDSEASWSTPEPLVLGRGELFGGRLLDITADPNGGAVMVYGRQATDTFLMMRRLPPDSDEWSGDMLITFGDRGTFPSVAVATAGNVYIAYNVGSGATVDVGAVAVPFRSIEPGPEVVVTQDQVATQGRAVITVDEGGSPWLIYFNEPPGGVSNEVMVLRNAQIPITVAEALELAAENATPTPDE